MGFSQNERAPAQEWCKSGANRSTPAKGKARDLIEITGLFWLRELETTDD
jgi:hypothetical protein